MILALALVRHSVHLDAKSGASVSPHSLMRADICRMAGAAVVAAAALAACSETPTRNVVTAYVATAEQWIDRCANVRRTPDGESKRQHAVCVRQAHESVEPLYSTAAAAVRSQRGTTMYLKRYRTEWNAVMVTLGHGGSTDEQERTVQEQRKALHDLAAKLTVG